MRIDCPKCGAAFAIDERLVPPKGVRAQCPLCGERVVVRLPGGRTGGGVAAPGPGAPVAAGTPVPVASPELRARIGRMGTPGPATPAGLAGTPGVAAGFAGTPGPATAGFAGTPGPATAGFAGTPGPATAGLAGTPGPATAGLAGTPGLATAGLAGTPGPATAGFAGTPGLATAGLAGTPGPATAGFAGTPGPATAGFAGTPGVAAGLAGAPRAPDFPGTPGPFSLPGPAATPGPAQSWPDAAGFDPAPAPASLARSGLSPAPLPDLPEPAARMPAPLPDLPEPAARTPAPLPDLPEPAARTPAPLPGLPEPAARTPAPFPDPPEPAARTPAPFLATVGDPTLTPGPLGLVTDPPSTGRAAPASSGGNAFAFFDDLPRTPPGGMPRASPRPGAPDPLDCAGSPGPAGAPSFPTPPPAFPPGGGASPRPEPTASDILAELAPPLEHTGPLPAVPPAGDDPFGDLDPVRELTSPGLDLRAIPAAPSVPVSPPEPPAPPKPPGPDGAVWRIKRSGGAEDAPVNFARLKAMVEAHELAPDDEIARGETTFYPVSTHPAVQSILRRSRPVVARADLPRPTRRFAFPAWALAAAALAAVALALVAWKAWPRAEPPAQRIALAAYQKRVAAWKASLPTPPGTAAAHEKQGRALLREDTPEALRSAREEFRRAAVLDPEATGAVAGYVEAGALLGFSADEREAIAEARDLIDFAAGAAGQNPAVLRANAHLLLSLPSAGNLIQARTLAEAALQRSDGAPEDLVAVGRSYIATNVDLALHSLDEALRKDPQNRRALLYRGEAKERVARYAAAADDYERRLALSPGDPEALRALLRVTAGVGAFDRLRRILDGLLASHPGDPEARLGLGILAYQIEGDARRAAGLFAGLIADRTLPAEVRARAAAHAAALAREAGDLDEAGRLVAGVTEPGAVGAPARYQEALVDLARGRPDEARAALAAIPTGVLDEGERALLEGRIHVAGTRLKEAAAAFQAAQRASPRRIDPYLHLAAANARLGEPTGAFGALRGALDLDPAAGRDRRVLTDFYESPTSRLAGLEAPLRALADERVDRALAHAAAGVVRYHQGEAGAAVPLLEHALDLDPQTMPALAYLAQIALDRGQATRALELARTASRLERLLALGPFLEGRAEEALDRPADARAAYERALDANPSFHPAAVRLGALSLREGNRAEAERRFFQVFQGDPENSEAKVALFQLGR